MLAALKLALVVRASGAWVAKMSLWAWGRAA